MPVAIDQNRFQKAIKNLYGVVHELESMFPGRPFTPDGHLIGSLGECLVAAEYNLELMTPSNKGFDAVDKRGRQIEIKATQSRQVGFRSDPPFCIVIQLNNDGTFDEIYNGTGNIIWKEFTDKPLPSNGQYQISLTRLSVLQQSVPEYDRIQPVEKLCPKER